MYTDQQHNGLDGSSSGIGKSGHEAKMAMDEPKVAVIGNEFLKRKIDHVLEPKGREKLRAVESLVVENPTFDVGMTQVAPVHCNESPLHKLLGSWKAPGSLKPHPLVEVVKLSLVFISEAKRSVHEMQNVLQQFDEFTGVFADSRGRSCGVGMLWKRDMSVDFLSSSINHIDVKLKWRLDGPERRFTGIYGYPENYNKLKTCNLILDLQADSLLPWLIGGDLSEVLFDFEMEGGPMNRKTFLKHSGTP